jgi:hypothetical protein
MFSRNTIEYFFKLAKSLIENSSKRDIPTSWPLMGGVIPVDINTNKVDDNTLYLTGELYKAYGICLLSLLNEKKLEYLSQRTIDKELWHLTCEVFFNPDLYKSEENLNKAFSSFQERLKKPIVEYEILVPIENLKLGTYQYEINGIKLFEMSAEFAEQWSVRKDNVIDEKAYKEALGKVVASFRENSADIDKATELARDRVNALIDTLRVSLLIDHKPRIVEWIIHDEQMLFTKSEMLFIRKNTSTDLGVSYWERCFRPVELKIDDTYNKQLITSKPIIEDILNYSSLKIRRRYERAIYWISHSITTEEMDYKAVDICTALETLLTKKGDKKKGEFITLRMQLLSMKLKDKTYNPIYVMEIYEKRSNIIHGSSLKICSKSDYRKGLSISLDTMVKSFIYIQTNGIKDYDTFLSSLQDDKELLDKAVIFWKDPKRHKYQKEILTAIKLMSG